MENSLNEFFDARDEHSVATASASVENSYATAQRTDDRSVTVASVTAAEPIEDDQDDNSYYDKHIPTIRLSSLGCAMEKDVEAVRNAFNSTSTENDDDDDDDGDTEGHFSDELTTDGDDKSNYLLQKRNLASKLHDLSDSNPVTPSGSSEEITVEDQQAPPRRQRLVSDDGIIAEFDINGDSGGHNDSDNDDVVAEAVQIDNSSHCDMSFRSEMEDLELGDVDPLPYPGRRHHGSRNSSDAYNRTHLNASGLATGIHGRAELLSATVIKNSPTEQIGINLMRDETVVYSINRGEEDEGNSLLRHCPFQAGDRVLSINNKRTQHMDSAEAARILREASGFVTIVCHNPGGDPCLIETMITKANRNQRSGMGLKSTGSRDLRVSSINENGLFAQSLLNVGDRILTINEVDVTEVDARIACDIIKSSPDRVTIVARQSHTTAVVVAEVSTRGLRTDHTDFPLETVHEAGARVDPNEIEAFDDSFHLTKQQREQLLVALCVALLLIGVLAGIFGRSDEKPA